MRIKCPHCGDRDVGEFAYLGDASKARPEGTASTPEAMFDYVYLRGNPAGIMTELWYHAAGCHAWLAVSRHTITHDITNVEIASEMILRRKAVARS